MAVKKPVKKITAKRKPFTMVGYMLFAGKRPSLGTVYKTAAIAMGMSMKGERAVKVRVEEVL